MNSYFLNKPTGNKSHLVDDPTVLTCKHIVVTRV